jgi:ubiquinone/menaquinone biosynthesis C-methylase UbiE
VVSSVHANREHWNRISTSYQAEHDPQIGAQPRLWGAFSLSDDQLGALDPVKGKDVLEVGCGAGQWSRSLAADGARVVGLDLSEQQLAAAATGMSAARYRLVQAAAEQLPFAAASFDVVLSDSGGLSWAPPQQAVPEAARVLRPGGRLVFCHFSPLAQTCYDEQSDTVTDRLHQSYFDLGRIAEPGGASHYHLTYGGWVRVLRQAGLNLIDLIEPRPRSSESSGYYEFSPPDWAARWPCESLWIAAKPVHE